VQRYLAICALALAFVASCKPALEQQAPAAAPPKAVVIVSANMEWRVVKAVYPDARLERTPWGEAFEHSIDVGGRPTRVVFFHGGWGKVAAAGSAQYAIDRWRPAYVINLGTCGGFAGAIEKHAVVLADRTIIYDIKEAMGDSAEAIADYTVAIDLSWLTGPPPSAVQKTLLVSADRDLVPAELEELKTRYGAIAGDWESGAIAYTCQRNRQRVLILRGVSDVVGSTGGEAYGNLAAFAEGADVVMRRLLGELPAWLARCP
jgi:adenosylhomocysteine nucleosidase